MNGMLSATLTLAPLRIVRVTVTDDTLSVDLEDGRTIVVPIGWYPRLAYGTPAERANFHISSAGRGIHWSDLDEDVGVEGWLPGKKSSESHASFERWLQRRQARGRTKVKRRPPRPAAAALPRRKTRGAPARG
jgi:hypothetical protein